MSDSSNRLAYYLFRLRSGLRWYARGRTRYDVHSPFLNEFVNQVYRDDREYHAYGLIAALRRYWSGRTDVIQLQELGAPSRTTTRAARTASSLVRTNAIAEPEGQLLFALAIWLRPQRTIEFGTNAGISTLYLHLPDPRRETHTVEGNPAVAALARQSFEKTRTPNVHAYNMLFGDWLREVYPNLSAAPDWSVDLFFCDGDHRYQPTLDYVAALLPHRTEDSVFVIADIHWSAGMERAWEELKALPEVTASVDTYHFGLLFFKPGLNGPHLTLLPTWAKPWRMGFFS